MWNHRERERDRERQRERDRERGSKARCTKKNMKSRTCVYWVQHHENMYLQLNIVPSTVCFRKVVPDYLCLWLDPWWYLYNFDPLKPHFYIVKLGFTGVYMIFLVSAQKHRLCVLVRTASPRRFKRVPTIYVWRRNMKTTWIFHLNVFIFWW